MGDILILAIFLFCFICLAIIVGLDRTKSPKSGSAQAIGMEPGPNFVPPDMSLDDDDKT